MRKEVLLLAWAALAFSFAGKAEAGDIENFQFAPPPFPILNLRSVDVETNWGADYIGMKVGDFKFHAINYGASRAVKKWDRGGFSMGGNAMMIVGLGDFGGTDLTMFGQGAGIQPNWYFDLKGDEEDDFSLPFYFGPHLSANYMFGSLYGTGYSAYFTASTIMYGWQAGIQAGVNVGEYVKFIPYLDFSQEVGGTVGTTTSIYYTSAYIPDSSDSTSTSIKSMPVAMQPGFDIQLRKVNLSLGGAVQNSKNAGGTKTKTTVFHLRFQHKFRSICGI